MRCKRRLRIGVTLFAGPLLLMAGCKTSADAAAAATQMATTAKSLCDYYTALKTILDNTDQLYLLNAQLYAKPYPAENRRQVKDTEPELEKRAELASDFSTLSAEFGKLTGSTAPADVATSASKLEGEVDTLASIKASSVEQAALKTAFQLLTTAIKEHKEREAAKAMDDATRGLSDLFAKETDVWNSTEVVYSSIGSTLAGNLVDGNATDNSALLKVALDPFGLSPVTASADLNAQLAPLAKQQIATKKADMDSAYEKATDAMTKSLQEMSQRIHTVAEDKPMAYRSAPLSVSTVEAWASQIMSTGSTTSATPASKPAK
jgi:hypothetical protein